MGLLKKLWHFRFDLEEDKFRADYNETPKKVKQTEAVAPVVQATPVERRPVRHEIPQPKYTPAVDPQYQEYLERIDRMIDDLEQDFNSLR